MMGCALTDGTHPTRRNGAWSDGMWLGYGPPLPHAGHEKQGATARRRLSALPGGTWKGPTTGSPPGETNGLPESIGRLRQMLRDR